MTRAETVSPIWPNEEQEDDENALTVIPGKFDVRVAAVGQQNGRAPVVVHLVAAVHGRYAQTNHTCG